MGRIEKLKIEAINEANKRVLTEQDDTPSSHSEVEVIVGDMVKNISVDTDTNRITMGFGLYQPEIEEFIRYYSNNINPIPTDRIRENMVEIYSRFFPSIEDAEIQDEVWKEYLQGVYKHIIPQ